VLRDRQPHQKLRVLPQARTNLALALTFFITAKEGERCTVRTVETCRWSLERFIAWLHEQGADQVEELTANHVRLFLAELAKHDYAASYIHIYARTLKTWLRFMFSEELVPIDIMAKVAMPRLDKTILPAFTPDEVRRLIDACDSPRDLAVVYCLLDSGAVRRSCAA
jgi:site-specific recombinase XerD